MGRTTTFLHRLRGGAARAMAGLGLRGECVWPGARTDLFVAHESIYAFGERFARAARVLDAGCGTGYGSARLARFGARQVTGVDRDPRSIRFATRHYRGPRLDFRVADLDTLALDPGSVDFVVSSNVLEQLQRPARVVRELFGALVRGGRALVAVSAIVDELTRARSQAIPYHASNLEVGEWVELFQRAGFLVHTFRHDFAHGIDALDFASPVPSRATVADFEFPIASLDEIRRGPTLGMVALLSKPL